MRYRCVDVSLYRAGGNLFTAQAGLSGATRVIDPPMAHLLSGCRAFRTLAEHAQQLAPGLKAAPAQLEARLQQLADAGLLMPYERVLDRARCSRLPAPPPLGAIAIPTRDRLHTLLRAVESLIASGEVHGRAPELVIMDDSSAAGQRECREALARLRERTGRRILHAGTAEKDALRAALERRCDLPPELLQFALGNPCGLATSYGANHNAFLLHGAGELFLGVDDDILCQVAPLRRGPQALRLTAQDDVTELTACGDHGQVLAQVQPEERDLLALHETLLGRGVGDCLQAAAAEGPADLDEVSGPMLRALSPRARVAITSLGLFGDSGMGSPAHYLRLQGASRERLLRSEGDYLAACGSRQLLRAAPAPTISAGTYLMSYCLGYDGRGLLPPFFPVLRNTDGLFVTMLRLCFRDSYVGHLPFGVLHAPAPPRSFPAEGRWTRAGLEMTLLLSLLLSRFTPRQSAEAAGDGAAQLRALGEHLADVGQMPPPEFEALARYLVLRHSEQRITQLEALLSQHRGQPAYWARDVGTYVAALREARARPDGHVPTDLPQKGGGAMALAQGLVLRYGKLLQVWPAVWEAAKELRRERPFPTPL